MPTYLRPAVFAFVLLVCTLTPPAQAQEAVPDLPVYCPPRETFVAWINGPPARALAQRLELAQAAYAAAADPVVQIEATGELAAAWTAIANERAYVIRWGIACYGT